MFGRQKEYFSKQYRRRTFCSIVLYCVTFLSAFRDDEINTSFQAPTPKLSDYRPFAPHAQVIGQDEIKVKWLPAVINRIDLSIYYELYNGNDIEYVGQDLAHVAKRLHHGDEYMFQLRVCNTLVLGDCSLFSTPRYQKLYDPVMETSYQAFIQSQMRTLPMIGLLSFFISITWVGWLLLSYLSNSLDDIIFDVIDARLVEKTEKNQIRTRNHNLTIKQNEGNQQNTQPTKTMSHVNDQCSAQQCSVGDESQKYVDQQQSVHNGKLLSQIAFQSKQTEQQFVPKQTTKKTHRRRSKTIGHSSEERRPYVEKDLSHSDSELNSSLKAHAQSIEKSVVVVVDNSNIFIGARETVCNTHAQIKPKQVKLRLQQLLSVAEGKRKVARGFTAGSSPPSSEHVWDIYRRHGYTVDLEDRRGKDEQRVDEQLHLAIYKALLELPAQTLILVTGDGHKGKSRGETSFISCAFKAMQLGWNVEVLSWKHSLSTEWSKLSTRHTERIKIIYLDEYVDVLTQVERRNMRRKLEERLN